MNVPRFLALSLLALRFFQRQLRRLPVESKLRQLEAPAEAVEAFE